jgi:predicted metalloendopeptidase
MKTKRVKHNHTGTKKIKHIAPEKENRLVCKGKTSPLDAFEKKFETNINKNLKSENNIIHKQLIKLLNTQFTPSKIKAQNDYYTYINYHWIDEESKKIKTTKQKKFYVQVDSFRIAQEKVYYELMDYTKEYIKNNNTPKSRSIKNLYESMLHLDDKAAEDFIKFNIHVTEVNHASNDYYTVLAYVNSNEVISWACPVSWSVLKDKKHSDTYRSNISQPQLTAYDYLLYTEFDSDSEATIKYKRLYKHKFLEFVTEMFDACMGKGNGYKATDVWDAEIDLLMAMGCGSVKHESKEWYNVVKAEESLEKYGFDWPHFTKLMGYKEVPKTYICGNLSYLKCVMEMMLKDNAWKSHKWKTYQLYVKFRQTIRFHSKWRMIYYNFFGKFIKGQPTPWPLEIYPVFALSLAYNTFLTNEYVRHNQKPEYIEYVRILGEDLLTVYKRIIKRNTWLSPKTKKYALQKLDHIKLVIGNPIMMREDPILDYDSKDICNNMKKIANWRTRKFIELDGKQSEIDIQMIDWAEFKLVGSQAYIVNAYYTVTENLIYIPLGILQKPFIDLEERGIEYNLAHIGYTLTHEMSHCLDNTGSQYDYKGNLHNWWTPEDRKKFNLKVDDVVKQYETFASYDGIKMDGTLSTGENLADISGMAICVEYLRDFQIKNQDIIPMRSLSFQALFIYFAVQARQKVFDAAIKAQLKVNPHPLEKYRTNCPLSRLELFRSIYNIKKGDKMWWHSTDTIW